MSFFLKNVLGLVTEAAATPASFQDDPFNDPLLPLYVVTSFVFLVIVLVLLVSLYVIKVLNMFIAEAEKERALKLGIAYMPKPSWWDKLTQNLNRSVPVEQENEIELEHSYDGIKELDNHLPPWWKWLFYGTIGWAGIYIIVYHFVGNLPLQLQEYQDEVAVAEEQARVLKASRPQEAIDVSTLAFTGDQAIIEKGKSVFMGNNCGSCHRNDGGGNTIGPNLTDQYWLHGGDVKEIFTTVKDGVVEKGMPAWGKALSPQDVRDVTFFIMSLQGSNPANGKAPQGKLIKTASVKSDSTNIQASL
jgi:cytochrome c oxidase cbb3-type subunit III